MNNPTIKQFQNDPLANYARKVALVESGNNPKAKNPYSSAGGLFQFTKSSIEGVSKRHNLGFTAEDRFDAKKSQKAFELFTKDNEAIIAPVVGREINDADRYLAHFLGGGGASSFFKSLNANPNAPVSFSDAVINANKGVLLNKDGSRKTNQQVYQWASQKMSVTPDNIIPEVTNFELGERIPTFAINAREEIITSPQITEQTPENKSKVEAAKQELTQKQNEQNLGDYLNQSQERPQIQVEQPPIQQAPQTNILQQYAQISQLVENPILQQGGIIPVSTKGMYEYPNQPVVVPTNGSITMSGINYPIQATSMQTGETQILLPNMETFFKNTQTVFETPIR